MHRSCKSARPHIWCRTCRGFLRLTRALRTQHHTRSIPRGTRAHMRCIAGCTAHAAVGHVGVEACAAPCTYSLAGGALGGTLPADADFAHRTRTCAGAAVVSGVGEVNAAVAAEALRGRAARRQHVRLRFVDGYVEGWCCDVRRGIDGWMRRHVRRSVECGVGDVGGRRCVCRRAVASAMGCREQRDRSEEKSRCLRGVSLRGVHTMLTTILS
jgi:hypothetical protein